MGSDNWIAVLALFTLAIVVVGAIVHFGGFLKKGENREAASNALVRDGKSATTAASEGRDSSFHEGKTLKERLDKTTATPRSDR